MAIDRAGHRPAPQPAPLDRQAAVPSAGRSPVAASGDASLLPAELRARLQASRPDLPKVNDSVLAGLSPVEVYAALHYKLQETQARGASQTVELAGRLRVEGSAHRTAAVRQAADSLQESSQKSGGFFERLWSGFVKTVSTNPTALITLVVTTAASVAGVIASGGAGIPAAVAAIGASAAPLVSATLSNAGVDVTQGLRMAVEDIAKALGADWKTGWKISQVLTSVLAVGISAGAALTAGNPALFDVATVGELVRAIGAAAGMQIGAIETVSTTMTHLASLGMLIGGSIMSGADVLSYGGLDRILQSGGESFAQIIASFSKGGDLSTFGSGIKGLLALIPDVQKLFEKAYADLQQHGNLVTGIAESYQAIVGFLTQHTNIAVPPRSSWNTIA